MMAFPQATTNPPRQSWSTMWSPRACRCVSALPKVVSSSLQLLLHRAPTVVAVQTLAGAFGDKASLLVDLNERALAMRTGKLLQSEAAGLEDA